MEVIEETKALDRSSPSSPPSRPVFNARRLSARVWVVIERDAYGERPHMYCIVGADKLVLMFLSDAPNAEQHFSRQTISFSASVSRKSSTMNCRHWNASALSAHDVIVSITRGQASFTSWPMLSRILCRASRPASFVLAKDDDVMHSMSGPNKSALLVSFSSSPTSSLASTSSGKDDAGIPLPPR